MKTIHIFFLALCLIVACNVFAKTIKPIAHKEKLQKEDEVLNQKLCDWILKLPIKKVSKQSNNAKNKTLNAPTENLAALQTSLDSLINAGANVDCKCGVTKNYRNLLQTLGNTMLGGITKFLWGDSKPFNETRTATEFYTPVHLLLNVEQNELVIYLAKNHKADLNIPSSTNIYPLDETLENNEIANTKLLVSLGASLQKSHLCTTDMVLLAWILEQGIKVENLNWSCMNKNDKSYEFVEQVLTKYKPNLKDRTDISLTDDYSPSTLDAFLNCGMSLNNSVIDHYFTFKTSTFLQYAEVFVKHGADFSECGFFGCPLEKAVSTGDMKAIKLIAEHGGLKNSKAICVKKPEHWKYLIESGLPLYKIDIKCLFDEPANFKLFVDTYKPNLSVFSQTTDLEQAKPQTLAILFAAGVKPQDELLSKFCMFQTEEMYDYVKVFVTYKQNIQNCGFYGCPLELAIKNDNLLTVKLLVENGTDVTKPFSNQLSNKQTPLAYAISLSKTEIIKYLKTK